MLQILHPSPIVDFDYIDKHRDELGIIVCTSGGFDPIHPGHLSCIAASKNYGDTVVVIVNGDPNPNRPDLQHYGAGETMVKPMLAAVANAVFDATEVRLRSVPFAGRLRPAASVGK